MTSAAHAHRMRALALALLAAALLLPGASATSLDLEPFGWACIPESPLCSPMSALCPRFGMSAGYCLRPEAQDRDGDGAADHASATFAAGDAQSPRAEASLMAGARSEGGSPAPEADADAAAQPCLDILVLPFLGSPNVACAVDVGDELGDL